MFRSIFLLLVCFGGALRAQNTPFEKITIEHGLSQGMIFDILQSRDGFLWVATKDGLNRYDGYNFKVFANDPFNLFSLAENTATCLFEDSRGLLWVGLETKGLDVYDPATSQFRHFPLDFKNSDLTNKTVVGIAETPDGDIWLVQSGGRLLRLPMAACWKNGLAAADVGAVCPPEAVPLPDWQTQTPSGPNELTNLYTCPDGQLLVASTAQHHTLHPKSRQSRPVHVGMLPAFCSRTVIGDETRGGDIWVCGQREVRRIRQGALKVFPMPASIPIELISRVYRGRDGHVWLSVGQNVWNLAPGEDLDYERPDWNFDRQPTCMLQDRTGNCWFGTLGFGLRKITPAAQGFHAGSAGTSIARLWRDDAGRYMAMSYLQNIFSYDPEKRILGELVFPDAPASHLTIIPDKAGACWLLCDDETLRSTGKCMLRRYGPDRRLISAAVFEAAVPTSQTRMSRGRDGRFWLAANNCELLRFDPSALHSIERFSFAHLFGEKAGGVQATALVEDPSGLLWIGTKWGLIKGVPSAQDFDFQLIEADLTNPQGLNHNFVSSILHVPQTSSPSGVGGTLWLTTKGGGINIMDIRTGQCRRISIAEGLLDNVVYGVLPGSRPNEFWCSTNRGLAKIMVLKNDPFKFEIITYTAAIGLQDNEFNTGAFFRATDGELLFGGINGLNHFYPDEIRGDTLPPPVWVVGMEINQKKAGFGVEGSILTAPLETTRRIELPHDQNNLSFEFAALDLTDPKKNRYRYRLVGLDDDWVEAGAERFAHFSHLPPGHYELRVQGSNGESDWREAKPIIIVVNPPWWRSNLAYFIYFLLLAWAGWRTYQFQIQRVKEREQLAFEHRETERVKALEQLKTNFFSNVTHEFRTPLTLIIEPLRQLLKNPNDPDRAEKIRLAEKNSRQLLGFVNQLLDMAKLESGQMSLDLRRADLGETVRDIFEKFLPLAEKRGLKLTLENSTPPAALTFDFDPGKVELVLNNLIFNALKFTEKDGLVKIEMGVSKHLTPTIAPNQILKSSNPQIFVKVSDTGIGIAPEHLDKIFDRFYQVDGSNTRAGEGTGIGLALSKELAERMGGGIAVESELGKGSTFMFWLPATADDGRTTVGGGFESGEKSPLSLDALPTLVRPLSTDSPVVLIIEDNIELRQFLKNSMGENWQCVEASDGEEGIKKTIELVPDLVISDVMMPRKDGFAVVDTLKNNELTAHVPIILLTAKSGVESKLSGLRRGADDYLTKPFSTDELLARMENLVGTRRKLRQLFGPRALELANAPEASSSAGNLDTLLADPDRAFLRRFVLLVEERLGDEATTVDDFAAKMLLSRSQLQRKIEALTGQSVWEFVRNYRLDRAHAMLKNREGRVSEIALRIGFGNEKHFSTVFKARFGVSPSQI